MTAISTQTTVGQLVADRPSRSRVFQKLGIDFCCGGKKPLAEVCRAKGLDADTVVQVLLAAEGSSEGGEVDAARMSLTQLCDHVERTHHDYLREELPRLHRMIAKVSAVHGDRFPYMTETLGVFERFAEELMSHMTKEERVLFPVIRGIEAGEGSPGFGSISGPIRQMEHEHDGAGDALTVMRQLTKQFIPPDGACNTFRATLDGLRELEADMHQHVHKENNVLFPRALELEAAAR